MKECLLYFIKFPEPGKVKTRLGHDIGYENAAFLYKNFVEDMLNSFEKASISTIIFYDDSTPKDKYQNWLGRRDFQPQQGHDLGQRMANAFSSSFQDGSERLILIGSDLPGLNPQRIREGFEKMKKSPACIGPAKDGGYYMIGFQKAHYTEEIFKNMKWSTPEVYTETMIRFNLEKIIPATMPVFTDVDTLEDLKSLIQDDAAIKYCPNAGAAAKSILHNR